MRKLYIILAAGLISLSAAAQTSEALPFIQMDFSTVSLGMGSTAIPSAAVLPLKETKVAGGVAYESYMPALSATKYISGGAAGALGKLGYSIAFTRGTGEPVTGEKFAPSEIMVNAGASYVVIDALAVGVNANTAKSNCWQTMQTARSHSTYLLQLRSRDSKSRRGHPPLVAKSRVNPPGISPCRPPSPSVPDILRNSGKCTP